MSTRVPWRSHRGGAGVLAPGKGFWPRAVAWTALLFGLTIAAYVAALQFPHWLPAFSGYAMAGALNVPAAVLVLYAIAVNVGERRSASELALARAPLELGIGAVVGFAFIALTLVLLWVLGLDGIRFGGLRHGGRYLVFNAYISAVLEELAFRAILLRLLARMVGPLPALIVSAAVFGLADGGHASPVAALLIALNAGLLLGLLYLASGRLWLSIGAHLAYAFTEWSLMGVGDKDGLLVVTPAAGQPAWLTGGAFGPDGSVLSTFVGLSLIAAILALRRRFARGVDE